MLVQPLTPFESLPVGRVPRVPGTVYRTTGNFLVVLLNSRTDMPIFLNIFDNPVIEPVIVHAPGPFKMFWLGNKRFFC
jgi:hypothetical protein